MWPPESGYFCAIILGIMVRILTKDYTELDLTKGFEFQIEMENPMLEEDHIPSAFSTQISFPPSPVNRKVFGYTPAMFLAPNVKRLEASVWIGGVPFVSGTLVYDGIEDGCLMYTFTEKVVELEGKIWEKSILEFDTGSIPSGSSKFSTPLLINKSNVAVQPYSKASRMPVSGEPEFGMVSTDILLFLQKYFNYTSASESVTYKTFIPSVPLRVILDECPVKIPSDLLFRNEWAEISILGRYHEYLYDDVAKPDSSKTAAAGKPSQSGSTTTDIASFLPDISFADLLKNLCRIFCATIFHDGNALRFINNADFFNQTDIEDLTDRISDDFSSEEEAAMSYKFGFSDDDSSESGDMEKNLENGSIEQIEEGDLKGILKHFTSKEDYSVVFEKSTGDVYSGRKYDGVVKKRYTSTGGGVTVDTETAYECDVLFQGAKPIENKIDDADDYDNSTDFILPKCSPEKIFSSDTSSVYKMTAIIEPNAVGDERDKKVYIGVSYGGQFFGHGVFQPVTRSDAMFVGTQSLTPSTLWDKYHKEFAEWLGKTRQRVSVDVNLSPIDLHNFRLYRPVYFKGRKWIVAKLSVTVAAGSEAVSTRGEFIEI